MWYPTLLCWTSLTFLIPYMLSASRNLPSYVSWGILGTTITSQLYHGSHPRNKTIMLIDIITCHTTIGGHIIYALTRCNPWTPNVLAMYASILYAFVTFWVFKLSHKHPYWHAILHLATCGGSIALMLDDACML